MATLVEDKCHQAVATVSTVLEELSQQLEHLQRDVQYWKAEASAWRSRYETENQRCHRLRRVLRCNTSFTHQHTPLALSPRAISIPTATAVLPCIPDSTQGIAAGGAGPGGAAGCDLDGEGPFSAPCLYVADATTAAEGPCLVRQPADSIGEGYHRAAAAVAAAGGEEAFSGVGASTTGDAGSSSSAAGACPVSSSWLSQLPPHAAGPACPLPAGTLSLQVQPQGGGYCAGRLQRQATAPEPCTLSCLSRSSVPLLRAPSGSGRLSYTTPSPPGGLNKQLTVDHLLKMMMAFTIMSNSSPGSGPEGSGPSSGAAGGGTATIEEDDSLASVSLDDDGSSGVGLAAAAAVSAAMARAWASAASREQRAFASARGDQAGAGSGGAGKAGFRLVATVTHKMGKRRRSGPGLHPSDSQNSLDGSVVDGSLYGSSPTASSSNLAALAAAGAGSSEARSSCAAAVGAGSSEGRSSGAGDGAPGHSLLTAQLKADSASAAAAAVGGSSTAGSSRGMFTSNGEAGAGGNALAKLPSVSATGLSVSSPLGTVPFGRPPLSPQQLGLQAPPQLQQQQPQQRGGGGSVGPPAGGSPTRGGSSGGCAASSKSSYVALHWLSRPRAVLVVRKLAPSTEPCFHTALSWLKAHGLTVYVEPSVFEETAERVGLTPDTWVTPAAPAQQQPAPNSSSSSSSSDGSSVSAFSKGSSEAAAGATAGSSSSTRGCGGIVGSGWLRTWQPEVEGGVMIPECVASLLDLGVILGGDGTVLWTCYIFGNRSVPPLVPFSLGSLGFLTPFQPGLMKGVLARCLRGGFPIQLRHRLHCTIVRRQAGASGCTVAAAAAAEPGPGGYPVLGACWGNMEGDERMALNEVVLDRGSSPFLSNLECFCDGSFVTHVQGDGLIVATPTGSTAYSLAAGGSMAHPQVPCILFTPICPHSLSFRPLMFPDHVQLVIQVPEDSRSQVWCSFDGKHRTELLPGEGVVIRLSKWPVPTVAADLDTSRDWFRAVRECLHWNLRDVQGRRGLH